MTDLLDKIKEALPSEAEISQANFEGSEVVLYTKNRKFLLNSESVVKQLAGQFKKRIEVRPDTSICESPEKALEDIKKLVPEEAGVKDFIFQPEFGRVIIESEKPGLVIGKAGSTLRAIKEKTFWTPLVRRAPPIASDVIKMVRQTMVSELDFRKKFLHKIGVKIADRKDFKDEWIRTSVLGAGREVGRSAILLQTEHSSVLMDCGVSVASEENAFPMIRAPEFNMDNLDAIVLSHAHLDHCGFIPYLYEYGYDGPLYCTPPTRDMMVLLALDYIDVAQREGKRIPYSSKGIKEALKRCIPLEYGEVSDVTRDMRLTFHNAGHILGSSICHLHIGEGLHNVLYTGDMQYDRTRLFEPTSTDVSRVETLIMESTYGAPEDIAPSRQDAEGRLIKIIKETLSNGGKVLIPSFAVGRAQEAMAILADSGIEAPVYLDGMLWDATAIHTGYPEYLSREMQKKIFHKEESPFDKKIFSRVGGQDRKKIAEGEPCVIMATSGMLNGGPAVEYLRMLAENPKNTLCFVGYQGQGSLGRRIQSGWKEIPLRSPDASGRTQTIKLNMRIETVNGLSGHADRQHLLNYVQRLKGRPERTLHVHGEGIKCIEMARAVHKMIKAETHAPRVLDGIRLR